MRRYALWKIRQSDTEMESGTANTDAEALESKALAMTDMTPIDSAEMPIIAVNPCNPNFPFATAHWFTEPEL